VLHSVPAAAAAAGGGDVTLALTQHPTGLATNPDHEPGREHYTGQQRQTEPERMITTREDDRRAE